MNRSFNRLGLFLWTVALLGLLWIGFGDRLLQHWAYAFERGRIQANSEELGSVEEPASLRAISEAFRKVAKVARPGVVYITVSGGERVSAVSESELDRQAHLLAEILGVSPEQARRLLERQPAGSGSGIIFDEKGYILTNSHVVAGWEDITVQLNDERSYEATLVGADPKTDLAVIKVEAEDLHALKFGDSDRVEVGDWVVAVGSPFGLAQTVTHGIVSATGRSRIDDIRRSGVVYQDFIQTDAAINPGNSGGPLLNLRGEVVGVNMAIATHGDSHAGVAFTIPSNMAVKIAKELIAKGRVARGWLGITYPTQPLKEEDVEVFGLRSRQGILVYTVHVDSPAERGGLLVDDVVVSVNGERIHSGDYFMSVIADLGPDENVVFGVIRDGEEREIEVRLGQQPDDLVKARRAPAVIARAVPPLGLHVRALCPALAAWYAAAQEYDETDRGVLVMGADEEGKIKAGEVIVGVEGKQVVNVGELNAALEAAGGKKRVRLQVLEPNGDRRIIHVRVR